MKNMKKYFSLSLLRVYIAQRFNRLILGWPVGGIPKSVIGDIPEVSELSRYTTYLSIERTVDPAHSVDFGFPLDYPSHFPHRHAYKSKNTYAVKGAIVYVKSGCVVLQNTREILLESVGSLNRLIGWGGILPEIIDTPRPKTHVDNPVVVFPDTGYYHWLLEVLPNLLHTIQIAEKDAKIIIPASPRGYQGQALKEILGENYERTVIELRTAVTADKVIFTSFEGSSGFVRQKDIEALHRTFSTTMVRDAPGRKLYVSRKKSAKRKISNEEDVEAALRSKGFLIVYAEELDFLEQIKRFSSAQMVVGVHGAGLANIVWCSMGTPILEIFPFDFTHSCFATLAATNQLRYDWTCCAPESGTWGRADIDHILTKIRKF